MSSRRVSLFIPCLVDQVYPEIGLALAEVLERLGYEVDVPAGQTCCGQPAFNAGFRAEARRVARHFLEVFLDRDPIVSPSGSCAAMVRNYYPVLFRGDVEEADARAIGGRVLEFSEFLLRERKIEEISGRARGRVGFHDSCHSLRELGVHAQPRALLERISGIELVEIEEHACCGFGGVFSVKFVEIASAMTRSRLEPFLERGVDLLVSNDPGCILRFRQEAAELGRALRVCHLAELLAEAMGAESPLDRAEATGGRSR